MDFLNPGLLGSEPRRSASASRTPIERYRDAQATARLRQATGPFILRRLKTDRAIISDLPEKIEMRVDCHLTREQATLYQAVVDEMLEKVAQAEGIERSGDDPRGADEAQAGLQPPRAPAEGPLGAGRALGQARAPGGDSRRGARRGRPSALLHAVRGVRALAARLPAGASRPRGAVPPRRHARSARDEMVAALPGRRRAVGVRALAEGGRHRPEPDRRQPRDPLRPLVEPGGRGPGDRPRVPDRPAEERAGAQADAAWERWRSGSTR